MDTPICDFVSRYEKQHALRLHMPGHKGKGFLGCEARDITEISGADSLYEADGIIAQSEANTGKLFGCHTFFSTEGSSLSIRTMLYLACQYAIENGKKPMIWAGRNAHKAYVTAAVLLGFATKWLCPEKTASYLCCPISAQLLEAALDEAEELPTAVYLTTPDYLGHMSELAAMARVCRKRKVLLLVDHAHGAYLKFLPGQLHPMDAGATACCDSAHKTLPVLTGGGYLHVAEDAPAVFKTEAKRAMMLFGSTSPSYLILQSLDAANAYLADHYAEKLQDFTHRVAVQKQRLEQDDFLLVGHEPLKLTLSVKPRGYTGREAAGLLARQSIFVEFADDDFLVMMLSPDMENGEFERLFAALSMLTPRCSIDSAPLAFQLPKAVMSMREAALAPAEVLPLQECLGRVLSLSDCACPPAVPLAVCGELLDEKMLARMQVYGIEHCRVVRREYVL